MHYYTLYTELFAGVNRGIVYHHNVIIIISTIILKFMHGGIYGRLCTWHTIHYSYVPPLVREENLSHIPLANKCKIHSNFWEV